MLSNNSLFARTLFFVAILLIFSGLTFAQFTADLLQTENGKTKTGKISYELPFYRMDLQEQGENFYVIVDQKNKISRVVRPSQKIYVEMNSTGISSVSNDVFQSVEKQKQMYETNSVGTETINNYKCKKYEVLIDSNVEKD